MALKAQKITNAAVELKTTPFGRGTPVVAMNQSAGALTIEGSDDGVTYDGQTAIAANSCENVTCRKFMRLTAAGTVTLLGQL